MKSLIEQDKKKRKAFSRKEKFRLALKYLKSNRNLPLSVRWLLFLKFERKEALGSFVKIKNRCVETYRSRSILRDFRQSRISFRELASYNSLFGLRKESW